MRALGVALSALVACRSAPPPEPVSTTTPAAPTAAPETKGNVKLVTETKIDLLDPITFLPGSAALDPKSIPILDAIASTLSGNPTIKRVAVQAWGADALPTFQMRLGMDRAQVIVDALVARGVDRKRLIAEGDAQPPAGHSTIPTFLILERTD